LVLSYVTSSSASRMGTLSYVVYKQGTTYKAYNNFTNSSISTKSTTDASLVIQAVDGCLNTYGGQVGILTA
jgi:hypothetical protein